MLYVNNIGIGIIRGHRQLKGINLARYFCIKYSHSLY